MESVLEELTGRLAVHADALDRTGDWPSHFIDIFREFGCFRWDIPSEYGGDQRSSAGMIEGLEAIARGSMTAVLIFTQHDAAADLIVRGDNDLLRQRWCPKIAAGEVLLTVGISQLTTSRQGGEPAMKVSRDGATATFDGIMPWVTSAAHADLIVTGGIVSDGQQVLAAMPTSTPGLTIEAPMELAALQSSCTSLVRCCGAELDAENIIRGPVDKALSLRAPVRPLVVSSAGVGLAGAMVAELSARASRRGLELRTLADSLVREYRALRERLYDAADMLDDPAAEAPAGEIRAAVNDLVLRLALATVTFAKGTGYLSGQAAQRFAREAMFFLVWSIPENVQVDTLRLLVQRKT